MAESSERWRAPVGVQVKGVAGAAVGVVVVGVFFPVWVAVPVAAVLAAWGLGMAVRRPSVTLDPGGGMVTIRMGFLTRRVRLTDIAVVQMEGAKVTFGKADGTAVSVSAWRKPEVAGDMAHAVSKAASDARPASGATGEAGDDGGVAKTRSGKNRPLVVMTVAGMAEVGAVFLVRVSWPSPVMTVLGALVALGFGVVGVFTVVFALWTYLAARPAVARG